MQHNVVDENAPTLCALTKSRVAECLDVSERHIQRLISAGKIRTISVGRSVRIPNEEVSRILREGVAF